jgi:hypothetical protein
MRKDLEPAGIGGWLILPAIGLVISPIWQGIGLVRDIIPSLNPTLLRSLSDPSSDHYSALWVPGILFEAMSNMLIFALTLWLAYLFFFRKSALVPRLFVIWLASHLIIQIIDWLLTKSLPLPAEPVGNGVVSSLARSIISAAIWIPYFIWSIRDRNTFVDTAAA